MPSASNYNVVDQALHYVAFCTPIVQKALAELENDLYRHQLAGIETRDEVFVTGLPRSGTTLVLELLYATGEFRTFTYRDMPFILAPLLWRNVSKTFRQAATKKERAHGDGMEVSFDSPEAFEEIIWLAYLRDRIERQGFLEPLSPGDATDEFAAALTTTIRKLLLPADGARAAGPALRYLSKNNANASRIGVITGLFPTATILVPFREPRAHVASLKRQHLRFLQEHAQDGFTRRYMRWLGHFEFGANLKPVNFGGWMGDGDVPSPLQDEFWMRYWVAAYTHALRQRRENVHLVDYDALLRDGRGGLTRIANRVRLRNVERFVDGAATLRLPTTDSADDGSCSAATWDAAQELHAQLVRAAV